MGCGTDQLQTVERTQNPLTGSVPDRSPCDAVSEFVCPEMDLACPSEEVATCLEAQQEELPRWCDAHSGAERCDGFAPSAEHVGFCRVEACYGADYETCIAEAGCAPTVCEEIDGIASACPGFAYDCPNEPEDQAACLLDLFKLMAEEVGDVCFMFDTTEILCADGKPTTDTFVSCVTQECLGLTTYAECMASFEILCSYTP